MTSMVAHGWHAGAQPHPRPEERVGGKGGKVEVESRGGMEWLGLVPEVFAGGVGEVIGVSDGQDGRRGLPREASAF